MIVLGIDPGSNYTGYGVVKSDGSRICFVSGGTIKTDSKHGFPARLKTIYDGLAEVIREYSPDECSIENIFYCKNVKSALKLGHTRGAVMIAAANFGLQVHEYYPTEIKQAVAGYGRASKEQVSAMVKIILNLKKIDRSDTSDALAAAICHINTSKFNRALKR